MVTATTDLAHQRTSVSAEHFRRRAHLAVLRAELGRREAALDHLRNQLHSFEGRYIRQVGVLYVQLDEWYIRIAELEVAAESIHDTERLLREARIREALRSPEDESPGAPPLSAAERVDSEMWNSPEPSQPTLRSLFREIAKRIHPDFALTPLDALRRTHLMAQANDAFRRADRDLLERMLHGHDPASSTPLTLAEILTQIAHITEDLARVDAALDTLAHSEMALLRDRTQHAAVRGRDLLAELAAQVKGSIGIAMRRYELDLARIRRKQAAFNPEPLLTAERS